MSIKPIHALTIYTVLLTGCATLDSYLLFGKVYCQNVPQEVRDAALRRMQSAYKDYPEHSICDTNGFIIDVLEPEPDVQIPD